MYKHRHPQPHTATQTLSHTYMTETSTDMTDADTETRMHTTTKTCTYTQTHSPYHSPTLPLTSPTQARMQHTQAYKQHRQIHKCNTTHRQSDTPTHNHTTTHKSGYTRYMVEFLHEQRLLDYGVGTRKRIGFGGPAPADLLQRCLQRMQAWVSLAIPVVKAEFPSWELLQAFSVFELDGKVSAGSREDYDGNVRRLAHRFGVDHIKLASQLADVSVFALAVKKPGMTNAEAWTQTVHRLQRSHTNTRPGDPFLRQNRAPSPNRQGGLVVCCSQP